MRFAYQLAKSTRGRGFFTVARKLDRYVIWDDVARRRHIIDEGRSGGLTAWCVPEPRRGSLRRTGQRPGYQPGTLYVAAICRDTCPDTSGLLHTVASRSSGGYDRPSRISQSGIVSAAGAMLGEAGCSRRFDPFPAESWLNDARPSCRGCTVELTPASLLERLRKAGPQTRDWQRLQELYLPLIRSWLGCFPDLRHETDDLAQEVMVVVVRELPGFERRRNGAFRAWLREVAVHRIRACWKKRARQPQPSPEADRLLAQLEDPHSDRAQEWEREHDQHVLRKLLDVVRADFEPATWEAFTRFALEGRPAAAVAQELGMSANAVVLARFRVLKRLRQEARGLIE